MRSCMHLNDGGYVEERKLLDCSYGSSNRVVVTYIQRLNDWGRVPPGNVEELDMMRLLRSKSSIL